LESNKEYKFGIVKQRRLLNGYKNIGICSCGQHILGCYGRLTFQCEKCGNAFFIDARNKNTERFVIPYLEASRKDNRGFKVTRTNLSVVYKDGFVTPVKENLKRTIEFDIVDKVLKVWRLDELEYDYEKSGIDDWSTQETSRKFFPQLDLDVFLEFVSSDVTRDLYSVVEKLSDRGWNKSKNPIKGLGKLMEEHSCLQILATAGVPKVNRFFRGRSRYYREDDVLDITKTKPHEILKVPKFMMEYIRQDVSIDRHVLKQLQSHFKVIDHNKFREIMSVVKDESTMRELANCIDTLMGIHIDYDYINLKKLVLYLFREVRLTQGIESPSHACTLLRDYIRMSRSMGLEWEKYPKSLKKEHDVVQMNYNLISSGNKTQEEFKLAVSKKSYQNLAFKHKKEPFVIIIPEASEDLIKEGNQLSHCVASYVKDVNNDRCKIVFLRDKEDLTKPLVTIEVRGMNIRQARGFANRTVTPEQKEFIKKWAEEKNLVEAYY
jgi:hypothetical protein